MSEPDFHLNHDLTPGATHLAILRRGSGTRTGTDRFQPALCDFHGHPLSDVPFEISVDPDLSIRTFALRDTASPVTLCLEGGDDGESVRFGYPVRKDQEGTQTLDLFRRGKVKLFAPRILAGRMELAARLSFHDADGLSLGTVEKAIECPGIDAAGDPGFLKFDMPDAAVRCEAVWCCTNDAILARLPVFLVDYCSFQTRVDCLPLAVPHIAFAGAARDEGFGRTIAVRYWSGDRILRRPVHTFTEAPEEGWYQRAGVLKTEGGIAAEAVAIPVPTDATQIDIRVTLNPKARFTDAPSVTMRPATRRMTRVPAEARERAPDVLISTTAGSFRDDILRLRSHFIAELFARRGFSTQYVAQIGDVGVERPFPNLRQSPRRDFDGAVWNAAASDRPGIYVCSSFCDAGAVMAVDALKRKGWFIVYEVRDDMEAMRRAGFCRWYSPEFEKRMCGRADLVICVSQPIREKMLAFGAARDRTIVIPNGIFRSDLVHAERNWASADRAGRTRVGYFGHMFPGRFDAETVRLCAQSLPDIGFDLVGPGLEDASLMDLPNVTCHGQVSPAAFFEIAKGWDVGILPFQSNRLTHALDPIKHYQYLAAGLKVVSTEVANLRGRPMTRICGSRIDFADVVAEQLSRQVSAQECGEVLDFLENSVWEKRFDDTLAAIERIRAGAPA